MDVVDVLASNFSSWYQTYSQDTFKSVIIELNQDFVKYLLQDGIILPKCCQSETISSDWSDSDSDDEDEEAENATDFPDLHVQVKEAIAELGGSVFVKLNWSSPKDANWMLSQGLKCHSFSDIILLLKSSDFVTHDLTDPFEHCPSVDHNQLIDVKYELILRRWVDVNPLHEFRCFVRNNKLMAICQRDCTSFISEMELSQVSIIADINEFFINKILGKFPRNSFTFDVWRPAPDDVRLVGFNPFGPQTDSLLFNWDELTSLEGISDEEIAFRYVDSNQGIQPSTYGMYKVPIDALVNEPINELEDDDDEEEEADELSINGCQG